MMTTSPLHRRSGLTLVESLVAMFVAALAMISLLALFPLGALQMAQALKDARCTETATNAEAFLRDHWRSHVVEAPPLPIGPDPFASALASPVFIDPIGMNSGAAPTVAAQAGLTRMNLTLPDFLYPTPGHPIPRPAFGYNQALRQCSLLDDMTYDPAGAPVRSGGAGPVERACRYNWMAVLQASATGLNGVGLTILVFDGRAPGFSPANAEVAYPNTTPASTLTYAVGGTTLVIPYSTTLPRPQIGKGRWIMLTTPGSPTTVSFYRVVSVNDETAGSLTVELQTPIRPLHTNTATTRAVVFAGLAEVFERPQLTSP